MNKTCLQNRICIIQPNKEAYSETFIRAQIERLPAHVQVLYGGYFPKYKGNGRRLSPWPVAVLTRALRKTAVGQALKSAELSFYFKQNLIQAVLAQYGPTGVAVMDACRRAGVPLVVHFRGFDAYNHQALEEFEESYRKMFAMAAAVIVVSKDMHRHLSNLGAPAERLHYNPSGVDCSVFRGAQPQAAPPRFVSVGRFVDIKAPHVTLLAFSRVAAVCPQATLTMVGDGPLWEACKLMAKSLKIDDRVNFPGPLPHSQVADILTQARAFAQHSMRTSYVDSEGTPVSVSEAGASGLPVVATRHGGIKDSVIHGETGFLVEEGDIEGMAAYMLKLAREPELAATMGRRGREHIKANFSMEQRIANLWRIIKQCIQERQRQAK
jgi:colanic acid/amylovoran biosynthesis glycosyltransferase